MKLVHVFFDVSMSNGHAGLTNIMKNKLLGDGEFAVFINRNWMAMKMLTPGHTLLHYKSPSTKMPINPGTIKYLPSCVNGGTLNYNEALKTVVEQKYAKWFGK